MLQIAVVAERASNVFEVIWTLQVVALEEAVHPRRTLAAVSDLVAVEVDRLES